MRAAEDFRVRSAFSLFIHGVQRLPAPTRSVPGMVGRIMLVYATLDITSKCKYKELLDP